MSVSVSTTMQDGVALVRAAGEIDVSNAAELRAALERAEADGASQIEVDLSEVSYMDSTGIGVLVGAANRAAEAGRVFSVANPQRNVSRVLSMLGVGEGLGIHAS